MSNRAIFGGFFNALDFYYGGGVNRPPPLVILSAPSSSPIVNPGSVTLDTGVTALNTSGESLAPLNVNAPILVGSGSNQETVTPSSVTNASSPIPGQAGFAATFANIHGTGDPIASATFGLQEAINYANAAGGGVVLIDAYWARAGGTTAIKNAAVFPSPTIVTITDNRT